MKEWVKKNGGIVALIVMMLSMLTSQLFGLKLRVEPVVPVAPEVVIVPEDDLTVFGGANVPVARDSRFSNRGDTALRRAGVFLKLRGEANGKLFDLLRRLHNDPDALDKAEAAAKNAPVGIDPLTLTIIAKIALAIATQVLEQVAPRTPNEWDDRLLALLKLFSTNGQALAAASAATQ